MANKLVRDKTIQYQAYQDGTNFLGTTTIELPEFTFLSDTLKAAGIMGEIETAVIGQLSSMAITLNWNAIDPAALRLMKLTPISLDLRSGQQLFDATSGGQKIEKIRIAVRGTIKSSNPGTLEIGAGTGGNTVVEVHYIKYVINDKDVLEIDKLNMVYKVDGIDYLAELREALGY